MSRNNTKKRFGTKPDNLGFNQAEIRPLAKCRRPKHPLKVEIRPGLTVYAKRGANVARIRKKYAGK